MIVISAQRAQDLEYPADGRDSFDGRGGCGSAIMGYGPVPATQKTLKRAGLTISVISSTELSSLYASKFQTSGKIRQMLF